MAERIGNMSRRASIGSGGRMMARWDVPAGLLKWSLGIFTAILPGLAIILIRPAGPMLASITSTSLTPSAPMASTTNTPYRNGGVRVSWKVQGTRGTNGGNGKGGQRTSAAAHCVDIAERYV